MSEPRKTSNDKLVSALRILAGEIESPDGVANIAIGEGADRIEELAAANSMAKTWEESFAKTVPALRARVAELEEKAERYRLTTLRQDARVAELEAALREMVDAHDATVEQFTATEIDRLEKAMRRSREILARAESADLVQEACGGRCGDPLCNLSTEGELMREPAKHPDTERLDAIEDGGLDVFESHGEWYVGAAAPCRALRAAIDAAAAEHRQEVKP